jgi:hypothetical protein
MLNIPGTGSRIYWWLSKGQNPRQCLPLATWNTTTTDNKQERGFRGFSFESEFGSPYRLCMQVAAGQQSPGGTTGVYILEFNPNQVKVQQGAYGGWTNDISITIEEVDLEKAFLVFYSYCNVWDDDWQYHISSGNFENSTTLRFRRRTYAGTFHIQWYVVECLQDQWKVQHLYSDPNTSSSNIYNYMSEWVDINRCWQFNSYTTDANHDPNRACFRTIASP